MKLKYSLSALVLAAAAGAAIAEEDAAVARTVDQVKMLDALYKTAIVLITEHYVENPSSVSAATASKLLFADMKKNGFHEVRLLGFTDQLTNPEENTPKGDFEETAKQKLLSGEESYKRVIKEGDKRYLYMATAVPVVMEKCVMCHAHFKDKTGPIGALSYKVPVIE
ncbi:c-type heme family protein [Methylocaldum sp. MU1018]